MYTETRVLNFLLSPTAGEAEPTDYVSRETFLDTNVGAVVLARAGNGREFPGQDSGLRRFLSRKICGPCSHLQHSRAYIQSPLPDNETVCGLDDALSLMFNVPEYDFLAVGLNVTLIVQVAFFASGEVQVLLVKLDEPLTVMLLIVSGVSPLLVRITLRVELCPTFTFPKLRLDLFSLAFGLITVPDSATVAGLLARL